ncbi:unnamed protein product [Brassica oleracea var. botrytis]
MIGEEQEKLDLFHRHCQDEDPAGVNMQPMLNLPSSVYFIIGCLLMELDSMREGHGEEHLSRRVEGSKEEQISEMKRRYDS